MSDALLVFTVMGTAFVLAFLLMNAGSNILRWSLKRKADAYAEFSDYYKKRTRIYVIKSNLFIRRDFDDVEVREFESRNRALIEFANMCTTIGQKIYDRG